MPKNLLVQIPSELKVRPVTDGASRWRRHGANLDAICIGYETTNVSMSIEAGSAVAAICEMKRERALARAETAVFEVDARNTGTVYSCIALTAIPAETGDVPSTALPCPTRQSCHRRISSATAMTTRWRPTFCSARIVRCFSFPSTGNR
jgi:hypothetical protein